jgi:predicted dehydrogenase
MHPAEIIKVYGSGITVREDNLEDRRRLMIDYRTGDIWTPYVDREEPLELVVRHFLDCVTTRQTPLTDGEAGLRVVRILEAAQRSIKAQGGRITL